MLNNQLTNKSLQEMEPQTGVILVCIANKLNKILTHDKFFKLFSQYGTILRILIFDRQSIWKAFVEFDNVECAKVAKEKQNNQNLEDDPNLKITIYPSQLEKITLQDNNPAGVDYTILRKQINAKHTPNISTQIIYEELEFHQSEQSIHEGSKQQIESENQAEREIMVSPLEFTIHPKQNNANPENLSNSANLRTKLQKFKEAKEDRISPNFVNFQTTQISSQTFVMQSSQVLEFMRQQLNFQAQLQQNLENLQQSSVCLQQSSFQQQSLSCTEDLANSAKARDLFLSHIEILNQICNLHNLGQTIVKQYQQFLTNSGFYNQQEINTKSSVNQIQFLKTIDEPQKQHFHKKTSTTSYQNSNITTPLVYKTGTPMVQRNKIQTPNSRFVNVRSSKRQIDEPVQEPTQEQDLSEYVNPLFLKVARKSKVIYGRWFDKNQVSLKMLYNMFSLYGNIDKMIYFKEKNGCLIQYHSIENADQAKEALTDVMFYGQSLKIFFSNYEEIMLKQIFVGEQQFQQDVTNPEEYFQGTEETNRYKPKRNYAAAPPCDTLFVMNLNDSLLLNEALWPQFQKIGEIKAHKQQQALIKNINRYIADPNHKHQCLLKYDSTEIALQTLVYCHGIEIDGRKLSVAFSKERL